MLLLLIVSFLCSLGNGEKVRGTINVADSEGFSFLGKFCFQYLESANFSAKKSAAAGTVDVELTNRGEHGSETYVLVMYDDQENSWSKIYETGLSCDEKISGNYKRLEEHIKLEPDNTYI